MNKTLSGLLVIFMATFVITGCKKYENGGLIGKADKRISANTWSLEKYMRNGNDETTSLLISNFTEQFQDGGVLIRSYIDKDGSPFSETGSWEFDTNKNQVKLTGVGSIELTNQNSTVSTSDYNVLKLKKKEYWYSYSNGGDLHEFHLIPN